MTFQAFFAEILQCGIGLFDLIAKKKSFHPQGCS